MGRVMADSVGGSEEDEPMPPIEVIGDLFGVAADLYRLAPWKHVKEPQILGIDIPAFGITRACLAVVGETGHDVGVMLFRSVRDYFAFDLAIERAATGRTPAGLANRQPSVHTLSFGRKKDFAPELIERIEEEGWTIAAPTAYPRLACVDAAMNPLLTRARDVEMMTVCLRAFITFFIRHRSVFDTVSTQLIRESITDDNDVTVTITAPYGPEDLMKQLLPANMPFEISRRPERRAPGRNDPCPCGSGKKYKKCHLGSPFDPDR
jgi:hypothetical protein